MNEDFHSRDKLPSDKVPNEAANDGLYEGDMPMPDYSGYKEVNSVDNYDDSNVYSLDEARKKANQGKIDGIKRELDSINTAVQKSEMKLEDAEAQTEKLENEIYSLEGNPKPVEETEENQPEAKEETQETQETQENQPETKEQAEEKAETESIGTEKPYEVDEQGVINLNKSQWEKVDGDAENAEEKAEYLRLKGEFKQAEREYYRALEQADVERGMVKKMFGLGRDKMNEPTKDAYDKFMAANKSYYSFAQSSGVYKNIAERVNREAVNKNTAIDENLNQGFEDSEVVDYSTNKSEIVSINSKIADRHVLDAAQKRLDIQTVHLPEWFSEGKEGLANLIKNNPKTARTLAAVAFAFNPMGVGFGLASRYLGKKFVINSKEEKQANLEKGIAEAAGKAESLDLDVMEQEYFKVLESTHNSKVRTRMMRAAAAMGAGGFTLDSFANEAGGGGIAQEAVFSATDANPYEAPVPDNWTDINADIPEARNGEVETPSAEGGEAVESDPTVEATPEIIPSHEVEAGENLSTILLEGMREQFKAGTLELPPNVSSEGFSHYMYQSIPELTEATDITPRFSVQDWKDLGVGSGNPHLIQPVETIDMQAIMEKLFGAEALSESGADGTATWAEVSEFIDGKRVEAEAFDGKATGEEVGKYFAEEMKRVPVVESVPDHVAEASAAGSATWGDVSAMLADEMNSVPVVESVSVGGSEFVPVVESVPDTVAEVSADQSAGAEAVAENSGGDGADVSPDSEVGPEVSPDSGPFYISPEYEEMRSNSVAYGGMLDHLTKTLEKGLADEQITLPIDLAFGETDFSGDIEGLVKYRLPELSSGLSNFFDQTPDALTSEHWQASGVGSGDPKDLELGEIFQTGKMLQYLLSGDPDVLLVKE